MIFDADEAKTDDMFADTRMSFGDHLEDLRFHLWRAIVGFLFALGISFFLGQPVLRIIALPVEEKLLEFYAKRALKVEKDLNENDPSLKKLNAPIDFRMSLDGPDLARQLATKGHEEEAAAAAEGKRIEVMARIEEPLRLIIKLNRGLQIVGKRPGLSTLSIQEALLAYFKVCIACGIVIGSPWIFYQVWRFIAAGLYSQEKRLVNVFLPFSLSFFLAGVILCQIFAIPKAIEALLWFNEWIGLEPDLRFNEWLSFAIMLPIVFGIAFQLPLVMMFLERLGIFTVQTYIKQWKMAVMFIVVFTAVFTPADLASMGLLALPMFGLYGLGILMCKFRPRESPTDDSNDDVPGSREVVEV